MTTYLHTNSKHWLRKPASFSFKLFTKIFCYHIVFTVNKMAILMTEKEQWTAIIYRTVTREQNSNVNLSITIACGIRSAQEIRRDVNKLDTKKNVKKNKRTNLTQRKTSKKKKHFLTPVVFFLKHKSAQRPTSKNQIYPIHMYNDSWMTSTVPYAN